MSDQLQTGNSNAGEQLPAPPPTRVRVPRLTNLGAVRREISRQYGQNLRGEISDNTLTKRVYALNALREAFRDDEVERRLAAIEERFKA